MSCEGEDLTCLLNLGSSFLYYFTGLVASLKYPRNELIGDQAVNKCLKTQFTKVTVPPIIVSFSL